MFLLSVFEEPAVAAPFQEAGNIIRGTRGGDASAFFSPSGNNNGRQLLSFGVSTSTITATATFTSVLTAICASTSGFPTCASG